MLSSRAGVVKRIDGISKYNFEMKRNRGGSCSVMEEENMAGTSRILMKTTSRFPERFEGEQGYGSGAGINGKGASKDGMMSARVSWNEQRNYQDDDWKKNG